MRIEVIPQVQIGHVMRLRVGDVINRAIADANFRQFRFAVAYMRVSGLDRLSVSIDSLVNRGGGLAGAIGVDGEITSIEALQLLLRLSTKSTIFHTVSGFIYHPKLYVTSGNEQALVVVGSPNLTRDGLFRNVELATSIHLDFHDAADLAVYRRYEQFLDELLNTANANVQPLNEPTIKRLRDAGVIKPEARVPEPGPPVVRSRRALSTGPIAALFPPMSVPVAPPAGNSAIIRAAPRPAARLPLVVPPATIGVANTFVMQLSAFDSSHRTGVPGTAEVLIPHPAVQFFPALAMGGRRYPDALFDVVLNTPTGRERHGYRLWYYEERAIGTRIDEYRLRMDKETIDLSTPGGGDLLVINKLPAGNDPQYEVTVLPRIDPTYPAFSAMCTNVAAVDKRWGLR
jgi:HKD family nuclease